MAKARLAHLIPRPLPSLAPCCPSSHRDFRHAASSSYAYSEVHVPSSSPESFPWSSPIHQSSQSASPSASSTASTSLPYFLPNFPVRSQEVAATVHARQNDLELMSALVVSHLSLPPKSPLKHAAHILPADAAAFASTSTPELESKPSLKAGRSEQEPEPEQEEEDSEGEISDQEWEIRTGRAIYILQETLPKFFSTGLISSLELPSPPQVLANGNGGSNGHAPSLTQSLLSPFRLGGDKGKSKARMHEESLKQKDKEWDSIYSPRVRLEYKPPVALPPPLPRVLRVEGLHLYIASSVFVRHTLNAIYTDLHVDIRRARVHGPPSSSRSSSKGTVPMKGRHRSIREKSFFMGLGVTGIGRVSGAPAEWEINCTYTFSPITGLVHLHTIDSIEPAPHAALFEAMGRFGLVGGGSERGAGSGGGVSGMTCGDRKTKGLGSC